MGAAREAGVRRASSPTHPERRLPPSHTCRLQRKGPPAAAHLTRPRPTAADTGATTTSAHSQGQESTRHPRPGTCLTQLIVGRFGHNGWCPQSANHIQVTLNISADLGGISGCSRA